MIDPVGEATSSRSSKQIYKLIQKNSGALWGGAGPNEPIYGELTEGSMGKILKHLENYCYLGTTSLFLDIGSGLGNLGKPTMHCSSHVYKVLVSLGIEISKLRYQMSIRNLSMALDDDDI